jgi:hypothetical protein
VVVEVHCRASLPALCLTACVCMCVCVARPTPAVQAHPARNCILALIREVRKDEPVEWQKRTR